MTETERSPLLLEIGCEEIPARMIRRATEELAAGILSVLDQAGVVHGDHRAWGGSRRLAVWVADVAPREADRDETTLGPPAKVGFDESGGLTRAALGFAKKQGVDPEELVTLENERGSYVGLRRRVVGKSLEELLQAELPRFVQSMTFPKTMRWANGEMRWVRPVHWVVALHGSERLALRLFGVEAGDRSQGHRFLCGGEVAVPHADGYVEALRKAFVIVEPERRRERLRALLDAAAADLGGEVLDDPELLDEVVDLIEWPGIVVGRFDESYLDLPPELLITTLRHHQKCFSLRDSGGRLLPAFLAVSNTDRDPAGHIRRGNEWVVGGRLEDARFFWREDRRRTLAERSADLEKVVFHARSGSYADKARRMGRLAGALAGRLSLAPTAVEHCATAARLSKNDLVTGTVGEFPELQGQVGGLLLRAEGAPDAVARGVYEHYRPAGPDDPPPSDDVGCVVSVVDKLDSIAQLVGAGQAPTGSRDPFGLRRAVNGVFRILIERRWPVSLEDLARLAGAEERTLVFLLDRLESFLRDSGAAIGEVRAVLRPRVDRDEALSRSLHDIVSRLAAIGRVRQREDFAHLADLTKRVDNILSKGGEVFESALSQTGRTADFQESKPAALELRAMIERSTEEIRVHEREKCYDRVVDLLARFVQPVEQFFDDVLVLDPANPAATLDRRELLERLREILTRCFDIRELAGEAERRE